MVKIILFGATGKVGGEILDRCIANYYVSRIICLTRRPLDQKYVRDPQARAKVHEIIHTDFNEYPEELLQRLKAEGAECCIWALATKIDMNNYKKLEDAQEVGIRYPVAAAEAFSKTLATALSPQDMPKKKFPFRFVFISSWGAEQDQFRPLWVWNDSRKIKGAAEKALFEIADGSLLIQGHRCFEVIAMRPGQIIPGGTALSTLIWEATVPSCAVDQLAKTALKTAMMGTMRERERIMENGACLGDDWAMINSLNI
ncbi:hypothetical protein K470DRAFT_256533 [Piedraia hortae CBS 480.64]|uniref:NAD(P)-binding domain-containing protein n=1 Tax=Piedraia hortae CBS 480.64 TaxID=1314780 RepID=A0A6A7C343_9PEZI|nr:hypothetical protein K470DRAFT_256533 [Piedraia hortae CBS 480.64]